MSHGRRGNKRGDRGFTLIELLVVITIILLVSAVALPTVIPALSNRQVGEGARALQAALAAARDAAIRANAPRGIRLVPDPPSLLNDYGPNVSPVPGGRLTYSRIIPIEPAPDITATLGAQQLSIRPVAAGSTYLNSSSWLNANAYPPPFPFPLPGNSGFSGSRYFYPVPPFAVNSTGQFTFGVLMVVEAAYKNNSPPTPNTPADWFWNVRIGDKLRFGDSGRYYTIVGPMTVPNPEFFVNDGAPGVTGVSAFITSSLSEVYNDLVNKTTVTKTPQFLFLVNGIDDDNDGYVDNGVDGLNQDLTFAGVVPLIDDITEWGLVNTSANPPVIIPYEVETWQGSQANQRSTANLALPYTITRRPVPSPGAQETPLPGAVVIDATTWDTSHERSRLPIDPNSLFVDIMLNQAGQVITTTAYSTAASTTMDAAFYHFWVADRSDVYAVVPTTPQLSPQLPIPSPPSGTNYTGVTSALKKDRMLLTLYTKTGNVVTNSIEAFDFFHAYNLATPTSPYDTNAPFYQAEQGLREAK